VNDISNILGGSFDFSTLSTVNIQQIEIVRGPLSSVYGSEAVAGVINVISQPDEDKSLFEVSGTLGNLNTQELRLSHARTIRSFDYSVSGSYFGIGEQIGNDHSRLGTVAVTSSTRFGEAKFLQSTIRYQDRSAAAWPIGSGGPEFAIIRQAETDHSRELIAGLSYKQQWKPWWLYSLDFDSFLRFDDNFTPPILDGTPPSSQSLPSSSSHSNFRRLRFDMTNSFRLSPRLQGHMQVGIKDEYGNTEGLLAESIPASFALHRAGFHANGELLYRTHRLNASLGLGIDRSQGFNTVLSPRLGVNFLITESTRIKSSWGKGFNLPSFYALAQPLVGNPKLRPEYSNSFDVGLERSFRPAHLNVSATYFYDSFKDLVDFSVQDFKLVNRTQATTQGVELETSVPVKGHIQVGANVSFLQWKLQDVTEPLRNQPRWRGGTSIEWAVNRHFHTRLQTLVPL
jgi:vitamin B12 transporter